MAGSHLGEARDARIAMPTLFRFLFICATLVGIAYAALWSVATFVEPRERDVTIRIPSERINPVE
ncbi:hypothetical protein FAA97_14340 [Peteryoungia ipomoeae]|uniref:Histidine kinase n=1 Tax=Peteryoungia ipomoeae TaxID=1210932 RepID=A0A4S8NXN0_9HYPH|nr:hypothetical protein FAA97_14340 [Peteryoungia ipomoeae]